MPGEQHWPELLWRLLAVLSEERRWLVWVAPPQWPTAAELAACNIDLRHVLRVHLKPGVDPVPFAERALASGKCSAVLAWPTAVTDDQLARIQHASRQGNALGLLNPPLDLEGNPPLPTK